MNQNEIANNMTNDTTTNFNDYATKKVINFETTPIVDIVNYILVSASKKNASDIHFQRGFEAAYKEKGFNYGYKAYKEEDVPSEYLENKYFLEGYKKGILQLEKETYKRSSSRR